MSETRGDSPESTPVKSETAPANPEAGSLEKPSATPDFTAQVKEARDPAAVRALIEKARAEHGLRAPTPKDERQMGEETTPAPAADIPPDLKAASEETTPAGEEAQKPEETAETQETPEPEKAETTDPAEDDVPDEDGPVTPIKAKRPRIQLPDADEVGRLALSYQKRNRDWSLEQALEAARKHLKVETPKQEAAPEAKKSDLPDTLDAVETAIRQLRAERKKANTDLRFEDVSDLNDKIEDMIQHRFTLERQIERQQAEQVRGYERKFAESETKAAELYPDASNAESAFGRRMAEIDADLEKNGDPLFNSPDKPLRVAQMVAREMSIAPRRKGAPAAPAAVKAAAPATPAPKKGVVPSGASRTTPPPVNQKPAIIAETEAVKSIADLRALRKKLGLSY